MRALISGMARHKAIIISTHILEEVEAVCTRAVIIAEGRVVADGTAEELLARLPDHNSIVASVPVEEADAARNAMSVFARSNTLGLTETSTNGLLTFRLAVTDGRPAPLAEVAHQLKVAGVTVEALRVERGRLDDVFRELTTKPRSIMLREARAVAKRELVGYFSTPVAYVFIVVFLALSAALTFYVEVSSSVGRPA